MTLNRRLYFPSEGRRAENFFALKIRRLRPGANPRTWVPKASTLPLDHRSHLLIYLPTHSMEQSPSWQANRSSVSLRNSLHFMEPEGSLPHFKCPPPVPIPSQINPVNAPHLTSWRSSLILSSHLHLGLPSCLFPSGFPTKTMSTPLFSPPPHTHTHTHMQCLGFLTSFWI